MGRAEYWDPVTQSRKPIKSGSIVNNSGLEYTPDDVKAIDNKINNLSGEVDAHKADIATQDGYGHIRLQDIKTTIKDETTGDEYKWGIENGLVYLERVVE